MSVTGNIFNIQRFSVHDGPGIRTTVFMQGCPLSCWWCHNPESHHFHPAKDLNPALQMLHAKELTDEILKDRPFFDESGGGVSFSGGEPLAQFNFLKQALQLCKNAGMHTVVDTSAYASAKRIEELLPVTDLFLVDLKLIDPLMHLKYTGISNAEILDNLQFLLEQKAGLWIRIPIIPGITDTKNNLSGIAAWLKKHKFKQQINLLPYHKIAMAKYTRLHIPYRMNGTREPGADRMQEILAYFKTFGFDVKIGG